MPGPELPAKECCSCPCYPSQVQRLWRAQKHSKILLSSFVNEFSAKHVFVQLSTGEARPEVPLLAVLLCRSPGLSSPGTYAKYEHNQDLASCLCEVLVMLVFHRSSVLLRYLAHLKKPKAYWYQGHELKRRSILKVQLWKSDLELF